MNQTLPKTPLIAVREDDVPLVQSFLGDAYRIVYLPYRGCREGRA